MDQISGSVKACYCSHADSVSRGWELRWMLPSGSSPAPPSGFYPSSYQLWVWTQCLLAQQEALIAVPEPGESLKPDATANQLWPLLHLMRTRLVVLCSCHQKEETRRPGREERILHCLLKEPHAEDNQRPVVCFKPTHTLNQRFPTFLACDPLKCSNPLSCDVWPVSQREAT